MRSISSWLLVVLACAACDQVLGIRNTVSVNSVYYDAGIDAPFACPPIGGAPPVFTTAVHQVFLQDVETYSVAGTRAIGICADATRQVCEGNADQPLVVIPSIPNTALEYARLFPDGQQMLVVYFNPIVVHQYKRTSPTTWTQVADAPFSTAMPLAVSTFARVGNEDRVLVTNTSANQLEEWGYDGSWHMRRAMRFADLGLSSSAITAGQLTSDGLRLVVDVNNAAATYTDRPDPNSPFRRLVPMPTSAYSAGAYLTADCARLYLAGLGSVWYLQQQ